MSSKIFVGGLSWDTTDASLQAGFESFGAVQEAKVITDRDTGRSRGFGFVTMVDASACAEAIKAMDGATLDGRTIRANEANDKPARGGSGNRGRGSQRGGGGW